MPWFRKDTAPVVASNSNYPKRSVRQVVVFTNDFWKEIEVIALHLETHETNELWLMNGHNWTLFSTGSRKSINTEMEKLAGGPKKLISAGMLPPGSDVSNLYISTSLGFGPKSYRENVPDPLFLGISLADRVASGWVPSNESELNELYEFFSGVPLDVGFFAPFKQILKGLTDAFEQGQKKISSEFASKLVGVLGRGYSVVEGRLADGERKPSNLFQSDITAIRSLPVLDGYTRPRIATLQFLSRKGLRLLKRLEAESNVLAVTRFKVNFLVGPQLNHSFSARSINGDFVLEDESLKYQPILTYILYGHLGLAKRDREARKVILGPRGPRHSAQFGESFLESLDGDCSSVYAKWINGGFYTNHAPIARHALALSKGIPTAEFVWNLETTALIANSDSEELQREALRVYAQNPDWPRIFKADALRRVLGWVDKEFLEFLFNREFRDSEYAHVIQDWVAKTTQKPLTKREVLIALNVLKIDNGLLVPARASLLFHLIDQKKLPSDIKTVDWPPFVFRSWRWWDSNTEIFFGFFGLEPSGDYPIGVLDVTDLEDKKLLDYFGEIAGDFISQSGEESEILTMFGHSKKPGALRILRNLLRDPRMPSFRLEILGLLQISDPTGNEVLQFLATELEKSNTEILIEFLGILERDSFATFWRKNANEIEQLLISSPSFPRFFWVNADAIPLAVRERILGFRDFGLRVLESVQPSSIGKMTAVQEELLIKWLKKHNQILKQERILRALLGASNLKVNQIASEHVKNSSQLPYYWLVMLESNLPYPQSVALAYLESKIGDSEFADTLLMALDSNNEQARTLAIGVLSAVKNTEVLKQILRALVENRNSDTWNIVSRNLEKLDDAKKFHEFTRQVFLSRRKARAVKEEIKSNVDTLIENIESAVEQDVLIRMALSSVNKDREWALKRIALHQAQVAGVTIENSWKSGTNV